MPDLIKNGKKVIALAQGNIEFYPVQENSDGSISFKGQNYSKGGKTPAGYIPSLLGKKVSIPHYVTTVYYYDAGIEDWDSENTSRAGHPIITGFGRSNDNIGSATGQPFVFEIIGEKVIDGVLYVAFAGEQDGIEISWAMYNDIKQYIQNGGVISPAKPHCIKVYVTPEMEVA